MKKTAVIILSLLMILCFVACGNKGCENRVMRYYEKHIVELKENVAYHFEKGEHLSFPSSIAANEWPGEHTIIEYVITGGGLGSASQYYGFFYSKDDTPAAFQNADVELTTVSDSEWEWSADGDNHGYVRRIEPFWFYFEAAF